MNNDEINICVKCMKKGEFEAFKKDLKRNKIRFNSMDDEYAVSVRFEDESVEPILILLDGMNELTEDEQQVVIAHEFAHILGNITNEEEADRWALKVLDKKQQKILISMWKDRHGHYYK